MNNNKYFLENARKRLDRTLFYRGNKPIKTIIKDVSEDWQEFQEGVGDMIMLLKGNVELKLTTYLYKSPNYTYEFPPHFHESFEVCFVLEGSISVSTLDYSNEEYVAGEAVLFKPEEDHKMLFQPNTLIKIVYSPSFIKDRWIGQHSKKLK